MTAALLFLGYAVVAGALAPAALAPAGFAPAGGNPPGLAPPGLAPPGLAPAGPAAGRLMTERRPWASRAPRFGIGLWLALSVSWLAAVLLAILALAMPFPLTWSASRPGGAAMPGRAVTAAGGAGLLLAAALLLWASGCVVHGLARARRDRREHAAFLRAAGLPDQALGVVILDQDAPAVYCLPGRARSIVVTAGARAALDPGQLHAVLAHERAHLRGRHHLLVATATALGCAFPFVPLLGQAGAQVAVLAEMAADDRATRRHHPQVLAAALVALAIAGSRAPGRAPALALTAGGPAAMARVHRLLAPPRRAARPVRLARLAAGAAALALPAAIACLPLLAAACGAIGRP